MGYVMSYMAELLSFLKNTINSIFSQIKELSKSFSSKLMILEDLLKANNINLSTNQELLRFLKSGIFVVYILINKLSTQKGVYSVALSTFLSKEIYDTKILQKMDEVKTIYFKRNYNMFSSEFEHYFQ